MTRFSEKTSYSIDHRIESFFTGTQLCFDEKGKHFYCSHGSLVNKVCIDDGQVKAQIAGPSEEDIVIRFAVDEKLLIVAYHSGLIMKFNFDEDAPERIFKSIHNAPISCMKINLSGTLLATGSTDNTIKLWNLKNHYCSHNLKGINGIVGCIEFSENEKGDILICSGGDGIIHVFSLETSQRILKLTTHCSVVTDLKLTLDHEKLISIGRDKIAVVWDLSEGSVIRTIPIYESVESMVVLGAEIFGQLGTFFATIGEMGCIKIWDIKTGSKVFTQNEPPLSQDRIPAVPCLHICKRPDHNQLCIVSSERDVFLYELPDLNLSQQLQGHIDEILSCCWFAEDQYLAMACNSNDLKVVEVATSKTQHLRGHTDIVLCVKSIQSDPLMILTSSKDCTVLVWKFNPDSMEARILFKAIGHTHAVYSIECLNSEKILISGGEDTTLKRWSLDPSTDEDEVTKLISNLTVKAHDARIDAIAISPNDQLVATGSRDKTAKIFTASTLQNLTTLRGHKRGVHAVKFSPVDQVLVTAGDSTLRMWNLQDFNCIKTFQGHECSVLDVAFLSSGLQMISVASDGNMKLWDCKSNECRRTIDAHSGNIWTVSLTDDDQFIVTGGQDERLLIWRDTTKEEHDKQLENLQTQVTQEQDLMNYINKKKWRKALKIALSMESQAKTLNVIREILLEPSGLEELQDILAKLRLDKLNFVIECCVTWTSSAKNSSVAQLILNTLIKQLDRAQLTKLPSFRSSLPQLKVLTSKSFDRQERLVQQALYVDFLSNCMRIQ